MNITTATPVEIDTEISRLEATQANLRSQRTSAAYSIRRSAGQERDRRTGLWDGELDAAIAAVEAGTIESYNRHSANHALIALRELDVELEALREQIAPLDAEYIRRGRWSRVYLVTNSNGHVHNTTSCRNCYDSTSYYWVTDLSAATDEEVVAQAGARTCLTCYSAVREDIVADRPCLIEEPGKRKAREERQAAAAARAEKVRIKGITTPDGQPLVIREDGHRYDETLKTQRAAEIKLVDLLFWAGYGRQADTTQGIRAQILAALAAKKGTTVEQEQAAAEIRLVARNKREGR